jgi:hypothetical protein
MTDGKVRTLQPLIDSCKEAGLTYSLLEEPDFKSKQARNPQALKFDFVFLIVVLMRKFFSSKKIIQNDQKIGSLFSNLFCFRRDVKNIVTVSQSFQSILRGMYSNATIFDYQHGILSNVFDGYTKNNRISDQIILNKANVLLHGNSFKQKLLKADGGDYFSNKSHVIGAPFSKYKKVTTEFNNCILISLQFSTSHKTHQNQKLYEGTLNFLKEIELSELNLKIYLRSHPRFDDCIDIKELYAFDFVYSAPLLIEECFDVCSLHITEYSTMVFDSIINGVPTILSNFLEDFKILQKEYSFEQKDENLFRLVNKMFDKEFYFKLIQFQTKWSKTYYEPFNSGVFLKTLNK